jgi:FkbM family methyltransferase
METNWLQLWRDLMYNQTASESREKLLRYKEHIRKKQERPDPLLDFIVEKAESTETAIDIGPGTGRWTIPLARKIRQVTAVEPSPEMAETLRENIRAAGLNNVEIVSSLWEKADLPQHDFCVCAHAMYNSPDLADFIARMEKHSRRTCYLSIRIPPIDGIMAELSRIVYGRSHDSADAIIAFNALFSLGRLPNLLIEENIVHWHNHSQEEAFDRAKRHLNLQAETGYDELIQTVLQHRLKQENGHYIWPDGMRSALIYWTPSINL